MSAYSHQGVVYFIARGPYVKIGYTTQPIELRMAHLNSQPGICPDDLDAHDSMWVVRTIPGCVMRDERRIHGLFSKFHAAGEWFRFDVEFVKQLADLRYVTYKESCLNFRRARAEIRNSPTLALQDVAA